MEEFLNDLPGSVLAALVVPAIVGLLALFSRTIRHAIYYRRTEFELSYEKGMGPCKWDIQWEGLRFGIEVTNVHNEYLEKVTLRKQDERPGVEFGHWSVSDAFKQVPGWRLYVKLQSIVRLTIANGPNHYTVHLVVRRPRITRWI